MAGQLQAEYGISVHVFAKDLSQPGAAERLWSDVSEANITVDILINNAGTGVYGEFQNESIDALKQMQMLNMVALTTLSRLALPGRMGITDDSLLKSKERENNQNCGRGSS